mgnify:CR=1 FL=1
MQKNGILKIKYSRKLSNGNEQLGKNLTMIPKSKWNLTKPYE